MKRLNLALLIVLVFNLSNWNVISQTTIRGTVYNQVKTNTVPSASVYINGTTAHTVTDATGHFVLENTKPPYLLVVSSLGYKPYSLTIDANSDRTLIVTLQDKDVQL